MSYRNGLIFGRISRHDILYFQDGLHEILPNIFKNLTISAERHAKPFSISTETYGDSSWGRSRGL